MCLTRYPFSCFQLTTSHGGRHIRDIWLIYCRALSTHDLTRRSTRSNLISEFLYKLSTHDLTRRSTLYRKARKSFLISFNSRPHTEVDHTPDYYLILCHPFNSRPHTEVDSCRSIVLYAIPSFQLTTSHGGRQEQMEYLKEWNNLSTHDLTRRSTEHIRADALRLTFQLTTSHGGRHTLR